MKPLPSDGYGLGVVVMVCENQNYERCVALANLMGVIQGRFVTRQAGRLLDAIVVELVPHMLYKRGA